MTQVVVVAPDKLESIIANAVAKGVRMAMENMNNTKHTYTSKEAAEYICKSESCMRTWRTQGIGPKFSRSASGSISYTKKALDEFLAKNTVHTLEG